MCAPIFGLPCNISTLVSYFEAGNTDFHTLHPYLNDLIDIYIYIFIYFQSENVSPVSRLHCRPQARRQERLHKLLPNHVLSLVLKRLIHIEQVAEPIGKFFFIISGVFFLSHFFFINLLVEFFYISALHDGHFSCTIIHSCVEPVLIVISI